MAPFDPHASSRRTHRVLALDGGGAWALIQAHVLHDLFGDRPGREILAHFDLVAATSGGGLVAGQLLENKPPSAIIDSFMDQSLREAVFSRHRSGQLEGPLLRGLARAFAGIPRYCTERKLPALRQAMPEVGDTPLDELPALIGSERGPGVDRPTHLLFTAFDLQRRRATFFRTQASSRAATARKGAVPTLAEALHATTNAPIIYFDEPAELPSQPGSRYWDGGLTGNNNPVLAGVTELIANGVPADQIAALSIGTANVPPPGTTKKSGGLLSEPFPARPTLADEIKTLATTILDDPPDFASFVTHAMLAGRFPRSAGEVVGEGPVVRINPLITPPDDMRAGELTLEDFAALVALDMDAVQDEQVALIDRLARQFIADRVPNQGVRVSSDGTVVIGSAGYAQARAAWQAIGPRR